MDAQYKNVTAERATNVIYLNDANSLLRLKIAFTPLDEVCKPFVFVNGEVANVYPNYHLKKNGGFTVFVDVPPRGTYEIDSGGCKVEKIEILVKPMILEELK